MSVGKEQGHGRQCRASPCRRCQRAAQEAGPQPRSPELFFVDRGGDETADPWQAEMAEVVTDDLQGSPLLMHLAVVEVIGDEVIGEERAERG